VLGTNSLGVRELLNHGFGAITFAFSLKDNFAPHQLKLELAMIYEDPYLISSRVSADDKESTDTISVLALNLCGMSEIASMGSFEKSQIGRAESNFSKYSKALE
jgi:hypothetical protein